MYPVWLRVWHWSNAILFVVLAYTGVRMHFGQRRGPILSFETAFNVHNLAGSLLVIVGVLYFVGNVSVETSGSTCPSRATGSGES